MRFQWICQDFFCDWWWIISAFVSTCAVAFCTTHGQNKRSRFDTGGFVTVSSLCGVVGPPSWFTKCLIGKTGDIWPVAYINEKCIYSSETRVCTIIEYVIAWNVRHVTSTWQFISWWYSAVNVITRSRVGRDWFLLINYRYLRCRRSVSCFNLDKSKNWGIL